MIREINAVALFILITPIVGDISDTTTERRLLLKLIMEQEGAFSILPQRISF